jgi:hypothetical protein
VSIPYVKIELDHAGRGTISIEGQPLPGTYAVMVDSRVGKMYAQKIEVEAPADVVLEIHEPGAEEKALDRVVDAVVERLGLKLGRL